MSVEVLDGGEEFPGRFGPDMGVVELVPTQKPWYDAYRPSVTVDQLRRTVPISTAFIALANRTLDM